MLASLECIISVDFPRLKTKKENIKLRLLPPLHCILDFVTVSHAPWITWSLLATESYQKQFHASTKELNLILQYLVFCQ